MPITLRPEQCLQFERDGVIVVPDAVADSTCAALRARAGELVEAFEPDPNPSVFTTREQVRRSDDYFLGSGDQIRFFFEEGAFVDGTLQAAKVRAINKIGHALHRHEPPFRELSQSLGVTHMATQLGQVQPTLIQSMYIFKQPRIGGEVSVHQDSGFLYSEPLSVLGFWIALEDAHRGNGCLWFLRGGHRGPLRKRFVRSASGGTAFVELDDTPFDMRAAEPLEVRSGTLVILHGKLPHRSSANTSSSSRHAYAVHCIDAACRYPDDNWLPWPDEQATAAASE